MNFGAGIIGYRSYCTSSSNVVGRFKHKSGANPHIGEVCKFEVVEEN